MLIWTTWLATALGACETQDLRAQLDAAETAFTARATVELLTAMAATAGTVSCLAEPLSPTDVARLHRARALAQHQAGDLEGSQRSLKAMGHASALFDLSPLVPDGHPLHRVRIAAQEGRVQWNLLRLKTGEHALVDGIASLSAPADQPYVVQQVDVAGAVLSSRIEEKGSSKASPIEPTHTRPTPEAPARKPPREPVSAQAKRLRWAALGTGVAASALYGGAWATRSGYQQAVSDQDDARLGSLHTTTNLLSVGSVAAATTSLAAIAFAEIVKR